MIIRWQEALSSLSASIISSVSPTCFSDGAWFILYSISYSAVSAEALLWTEAFCRSPALTWSCIPCDLPCTLPGSTAEIKVFFPSSSVKTKALAGLLGPWQCRSPSFLPRQEQPTALVTPPSQTQYDLTLDWIQKDCLAWRERDSWENDPKAILWRKRGSSVHSFLIQEQRNITWEEQ